MNIFVIFIVCIWTVPGGQFASKFMLVSIKIPKLQRLNEIKIYLLLMQCSMKFRKLSSLAVLKAMIWKYMFFSFSSCHLEHVDHGRRRKSRKSEELYKRFYVQHRRGVHHSLPHFIGRNCITWSEPTCEEFWGM